MIYVEVKSLFIIWVVGGVITAQEKRVLLHDEQDIQAIISTMQGEIATLKSKVSTLETNILSAPLSSGSVYVRWGRTNCSGNGTDMVYNGRMAGSQWNEHGGGSNHVCLPNDPTWGKYTDGISTGGTLYGTEIELSDNLATVLFGRAVNNEDVPCAVCRTVRPSNVMIPGRATCYPGWTMEYKGYVVASGSSWNNNADYVCLDTGLEFAPHGGGNDDQHVINVVDVLCGSTGSLPCPPYVHSRQLSCVQCSK